MNDSPLQPNQSNTNYTPVVRVEIPDVSPPGTASDIDSAPNLVNKSTERIDSLQAAINASPVPDQPIFSATEHTNVLPASDFDLQNQNHQTSEATPGKIDRLIDSILQKFPLSQPVTIVFVASKTDAETDPVAADVAERLAERRVGKVLLVDSNANSKTLSNNLSLGETAGLGNIICDDQPWENLLQESPTAGLDFLPFGNVNTAKTRRSQTANFVNITKQVYQFVCVSVGLNQSPIAKSFCNAADGIYLLIDLNQVNHTEAKAAADHFKLNHQPLVGCIALDPEQESK